MRSEFSAGISMQVVFDGDGALVTPEGELDRTTAAAFDHGLVEVIATGRSPLTVDLSRICFADVAGYRAMQQVSKRCMEDGLVNVWIHPSGPVRLLWRILGPPGGTTLDHTLTPFQPVSSNGNGHRDGPTRHAPSGSI